MRLFYGFSFGTSWHRRLRRTPVPPELFLASILVNLFNSKAKSSHVTFIIT